MVASLPNSKEEVFMPAVPQKDGWSNIPQITGPMDLTIPKLAQLKTSNPTAYRNELNRYCDFLEQLPLAKTHNKNSEDLKKHM